MAKENLSRLKKNAGREARTGEQISYLSRFRDRRLRALCGHLLDIHDPVTKGASLTEEKDAQEFERLGPFEQRKRMVAGLLVNIREDLKRKAELQAASASREKVEISQKINRDFKQCQDWVGDCERYLNKESERIRKIRNATKRQEEERVYSMRSEALKIMHDHMQEVSELKKPGSGRRRGNAGPSTQFASLESLNDPTKSALPEIDLTTYLDQVSQRNQAIDAGLRQFEGHVGILKNQALELGSTLDTQNRKLEGMEAKADDLNEQLYGLNKRLKDTLAKVRGPSKFCVDICCCVLILAIAGFIYNMV